jgi:hypothetical protein
MKNLNEESVKFQDSEALLNSYSFSVSKKNIYKYQIYPGNNGALVKRVMQQGCPIRN